MANRGFRWAEKLIIVLCLLVALPGCGGCGGGLTQADLKRNAIRRKKDEEPPPQKSTVQNQPAQPASAAAPGPPPPNQTAATLANRDDVQAPQVTPVENAPATPPDTSAAEVDRRRRTLENMSAIARALKQYFDEKRVVPPPAIYSDAGKPLLSWRVMLLPYLGHSDLYGKFRLDQPWNSPTNRELLAEIPAVFQSPERADERTNYLVPVGAKTLFPGGKPVPVRNVEDQMANTALLLEVDDSHAVPWTEPRDYEVDVQRPRAHLGGLRQDGFFVARGDAALARIPAEMSGDIAAMYTIESGDPSPLAVSPTAMAEVSIVGSDSTAADANAARGTSLAARDEARLNSADPLSASPGRRPSPQAQTAAMLPVPADGLQEKARKQIQEIYGPKYEAAKTDQHRRALARELMDQVNEVQEDPASLYVLLDVVKRIAASAGDAATALSAIEKIEQCFYVDRFQLRYELITTLASGSSILAAGQTIQAEALRLVDEAIRLEKHDEANQLCNAALAAARQAADRRQMIVINQRIEEVEAARSQHRRAMAAIEALDITPDNAQASEVLGAYLCFYRLDWENGLPILAKSLDEDLRKLAADELAGPIDAKAQVALGDAWWSRAVDSTGPPRHAMQERARCWYEQALPQLAGGFTRVKVRKRIDELLATSKLADDRRR